MTERPNVLNFSQLPVLIQKIEAEVKLIPEDETHSHALKCIAILLEIMNSYGVWISQLKEELQKLDSLNKSQAELLSNLRKVQVT